MSKMIPQRTVNAMRQAVDVSLSMYGIDCDLYLPQNLEEAEPLDIYNHPDNFACKHYTTTVRIEWSPNIYKLKYYGLYVEGELPILVYLPRTAINVETGLTETVHILKKSYLQVAPQYIHQNYIGNEQFELVDEIIKFIHDATLVQCWKAAPRRTTVTGV